MRTHKYASQEHQHLTSLARVWQAISRFWKSDVVLTKPLKLDDTPDPQMFELKGRIWRHSDKVKLCKHERGFHITVPTKLRKPLPEMMWPALFQTQDGQVGLIYLADKNGGD